MIYLPLDVVRLVCHYGSVKENTRLAVVCKNWQDVTHQLIHQRLVIYRHSWSAMKYSFSKWSTKPQCVELVIMCTADNSFHHPSIDECGQFLNEVFAVIDTTTVSKLALYDIRGASVNSIQAAIPNLKFLKLYRCDTRPPMGGENPICLTL